MILQTACGLIVSFTLVFGSIICVLIANIMNCCQLHWYLVVTDPATANNSTHFPPDSKPFIQRGIQILQIQPPREALVQTRLNKSRRDTKTP